MSKEGLVRLSVKVLTAGILSACTLAAYAQSTAKAVLPRVVEKNGHFAFLVDGRPYLMLGAQMNNSSAWPSELTKVWPVIEKLGANTLAAPVYWEQFEPQPGKFDPSLVDLLITQAREHHVHLVLLWFGTWKNGSSHYAPEWIKLNEQKYPHLIDANGKRLDSPSPFGTETLNADRTAFVALMRHLKEVDSQRHTVLMVQVENEPGSYGSARDHSSAAEKLFAASVPNPILQAFGKKPGSWKEVFGADADEFFHAWSIATYINQVAAAGKSVYPLPMSVNAALRDPFHPPSPGAYECGGPTDNVLALWKVTAPLIDVIGPDIYMRDSPRFNRILELYHRPDNAMFIPEIGNDQEYARYLFAALGHGAIAFTPFGMDFSGYSNFPLGAVKVTEETIDAFAMNYKLLAPMDREIAQWSFEGKLYGVSEDTERHRQTIDLGDWKAVVSYGSLQFGPDDNPKGNPQPKGGVLIAKLADNEFLVTGHFARVEFKVADATSQNQLQYLKVEEGAYVDGKWQTKRIWNGDQTDFGLNFTGLSQVLRVTLATF